MKRILIAAGLSFGLSGCVGLAVGTFGTYESLKPNPAITAEKNEFGFGQPDQPLTKSALIAAWGEPDATRSEGRCEVLSYYDGYNWSGIGAFVAVVPIPLVVPSGHDENRFYFIDGQSVAAVTEYGEVTGGLGYVCGSNECQWLTGPVNTEKTRRADLSFCE
ncbi:hypothetical protein KUV89_01755 [Marinobacter hydrocarbonoclasticus]|nr:hypothetical protein [Marinobacter nauticus]